ncbi:hypothetical protein LshimejAT787_0211270 [Lyophyllum shimeji]|uniref:F-box domain-containing protein n=1 Tax=Lyophyllum shimeji TaxID=47721 RepID=A0A9P3UJL4_LYOSH|nr:hypothetical protein LshimejAT787_0211270 [Lyophyllum shimeji]
MISLSRRFCRVFYSRAEPTSCRQDESSPPNKVRRVKLEDRPEVYKPLRPNYIHRLPLELLGDVFHFYVHSEGPSDMPSTHSALQEPALTSTLSSPASPFILSRVCWTWRRLSLAMPGLWSSLAVYRPTFSQLEAIQLWLKRSGNSPLYIYIHEPHSQPLADPDERAIDDLLSLLAEHAAQWRHFGLQRCGLSPPLMLHRLPFNSFSRLESVALGFHDQNDDAWAEFYKVPSLRRISWDVSRVELNIVKFAPWWNLTHVKLPRISGMAVDDLLRAMLYCVHLEDLELAMTMPLEPQSRAGNANVITAHPLPADLRRPPNPEPRTLRDVYDRAQFLTSLANLATVHQAPIDLLLPNLRFLKVHARGRDAAPLLDRLTLPALTSLDVLHYMTSSVPSSTTYITELLVRSGSHKLQTLSIYDPDLPEDEILPLLTSPHLHSLRHLELLVSRVTDRTIEILTPAHRPGAPRRLPDLRCLVLPDCVTSDRLLSTMVISRQPVLKTMKFSVAADTPLKEDVAILRELARQSSFCLSVI